MNRMIAQLVIHRFYVRNLGAPLAGGVSLQSVCIWVSWIRIRIHKSEVWIRIRILLSLSKSNKKNLDSYCLRTSL
jgi:hypothetical protein